MISILPNYQISAQIYESVNSLVYQAVRLEDHQPVILKMLKEDYPTPEELMHYRQEYEITKSLNLDGVVKTYSLEKYQNTFVIILEDFGGESLKMILAQKGKLEISQFLPIALQITESLGQIHTANVIHKDINLANIVWNQQTNQLKIIDFGIASRLPRENPALKNPEQLEGTLAYISPEQTGRMNRSLDYRTDLYSLGVTYYELLTGQLPFKLTDAIELVHCHIAKVPKPVCEINPEVPQIISDIVMKLMAKNADERYQSVFGLKQDLKICVEYFISFQKLEGLSFELGEKDFSGKLQIPQKLYGREKEINTLLQAFERVSKGAAEMMLVAGYSGVGKTALVHEVHKPMTEKHGYFAAGKFDQFQRNIPYSALTQAFNEFCSYLLTESSSVLSQWREKILKAVGNNGQVLIDVIGQLELVIGSQPPVAQVSPTEAQNRFNLFFQKFFRAICQKQHPLILFIDDLQWADSASLNLLKTLMADMESQYFLIIGAYRDNEVSATSPLMTTIEKLQQAQALVNTVLLTNLSLPDVNALVTDTLMCQPADAQLLSQLVYEKTQGNAFFTHEFLKSLSEQELLEFDFKTQKWQWDINQIKSLSMTDNVVELMASKIGQLPSNAQQVMKLAACLGNSFDLNTLSLIYQHTHTETLAHLRSVLEEGLLDALNTDYELSVNFEACDVNPTFKFQHDRVQQAAYSLITDFDKSSIHWQIGHFLLAQQTENLFEIADHLNLGISLANTQDKKNKIAQLNLKAGQKAKAATAYGSAVNYLNEGLKCLATDCWQTEYDLTINLHVETVEAEFLYTHLEQAETLAHTTLQQAKTLLDQLKVYKVLIQLYMAKNQIQMALDTALQVLEMLGVHLETEPPKQLVIENCYALPEMTAPDKLAAMQILNSAISPSYTVAPELFPQIVFTMVKLSAEYGNSALSVFGYSTYGLLLCAALGEIESGYQAGQLAISLLDKFDARELKAKGFAAYNAAIHHWKRPARETIAPLIEGSQSGLETGDLEFVGVTTMHCSSYLFWVGESLETVAQQQKQFHTLLHGLKQEYQLLYLRIWQQIVFNLQGLNSNPCHLVGEVFNEDEILPKVLETNYGMAIFGIYLSKSMLDYLFKNFTQSVANAALAENYEAANVGVMLVPIRKFYYSLALLATYPMVSSEKQLEIISQVDSHQAQMKFWASHAPSNYQHRHDLVEAEKARALGKIEAIQWYEKAIRGAKENKYLPEEALAYELAAEFYLEREMEKFAKTYLREAHHRYQQWGAVAKVKNLEERYPQWLTQKGSNTMSRLGSLTSTVTIMASSTQRMAASNLLDLNSVMKASQILSGEIVLTRLFEKMMNIVIENAGAQHGFLLLPSHDNWMIEAEGALDKEEVTILHSQSIENHLPAAIVSYVARTQENVVLADARQEGLYTDNPYIKRHQTKSVLCFPIVYQQQLRAILYLENNLTTGAFTPARLNVLKMLSSQIAISLENAQYATQLEDKVKQRTTELAQANEQIIALNEQLKEENLRMSAELDVAKQLQQMVLPKATELEQIEELEIAGFMEPADEVGGDYYDVLVHEGRIKIGIGDVTGHGLESGVLMLMVQTAVRTLLDYGVTDAKQFLTSLNHTIYNNVKRMGTDKNLTLSLIDYQDQQWRITGQHEDILLVHQNGEIEPIDTFELGFSVGITDDITQFVSQLEMRLQPGEGIVLYTDGITEARNPNMKLYGLKRLCEVVSHNWHLSAKEIQQAVIDNVRRFIGNQKVFDDITLFVCKQK